jgi:hypothetical protein
MAKSRRRGIEKCCLQAEIGKKRERKIRIKKENEKGPV